AYTLVDKHGIRHAGPIPYLELVVAPAALGYTAVALARSGGARVRAELRTGPLLAGGISVGSCALARAARARAAAVVCRGRSVAECRHGRGGGRAVSEGARRAPASPRRRRRRGRRRAGRPRVAVRPSAYPSLLIGFALQQPREEHTGGYGRDADDVRSSGRQ